MSLAYSGLCIRDYISLNIAWVTSIDIDVICRLATAGPPRKWIMRVTDRSMIGLKTGISGLPLINGDLKVLLLTYSIKNILSLSRGDFYCCRRIG